MLPGARVRPHKETCINGCSNSLYLDLDLGVLHLEATVSDVLFDVG
jgi:hypothetical protein